MQVLLGHTTFGFATDQTLPNILFMRAKLCRAVISETVGVYSNEIGQTTMKNEAFCIDSVSLNVFHCFVVSSDSE